MKKVAWSRPRALRNTAVAIGLAASLVLGTGLSASATGTAESELTLTEVELSQLESIATSPESFAEATGTTVESGISDGGSLLDSVSIDLPGTETGDVVDLSEIPREFVTGEGEALASSQVGESTVSAFASDAGVQTLIEIPSASAPTEYQFPISLPTGFRLEMQADGSVFVIDNDDVPVALVDVPWARDADGNSVKTAFRIVGSTIYQTVDTSEVTAFPVVADPDFWWIAANSVGCLAEIAGLSLASAKVVAAFAKADKIIRAATKLGQYYDKLGGKMSNVIGLFKKWVNNKGSLTRKQLSALEGLIREGAKIVFNVVGLGTCYNLVTAKW